MFLAICIMTAVGILATSLFAQTVQHAHGYPSPSAVSTHFNHLFGTITTRAANSSSPSGPSSSDPFPSNINSILSRAHIHGIIMSTCFLVLLPLFALSVYLPWPKRIPLIHVPLQLVTLCLLVGGFALGVNVARELALTTAYHPIIGDVVVAIIVLLQPAMGLIQHLRYSRTGERGVFGLIHQWTGRLVILLGVINGGCGLKLARSTFGWPIVVYPLIAAVTVLFYIAVVVVVPRRRLRGKEIAQISLDRHVNRHHRAETAVQVETGD